MKALAFSFDVVFAVANGVFAFAPQPFWWLNLVVAIIYGGAALVELAGMVRAA